MIGPHTDPISKSEELINEVIIIEIVPRVGVSTSLAAVVIPVY